MDMGEMLHLVDRCVEGRALPGEVALLKQGIETLYGDVARYEQAELTRLQLAVAQVEQRAIDNSRGGE